MKNEIEITSLMSEAGDPWVSAVAGWLSEALSQPVRYDLALPYPERFARLLAGKIQAGWVCGIVYVKNPEMELLAAPVMSGERYAGRPVYFSDLVVRRGSPFKSLSDLGGARFAYNERGSFSGDLCMGAALLDFGVGPEYFGKWIESGGHTRSIEMVVQGKADTAAIDSTVLDQLAADEPEKLEELEIIDSLGPYPMPPWVSSRAVPDDRKAELRETLLTMHRGEKGRRALGSGQVARFAALEDDFYEPIRRVASQLA